MTDTSPRVEAIDSTERRPAPSSVLHGVLCCVVVVLGYLTYFRGYQYPAAPFWDETYHIPSAQRYLNGVHFLEMHPPLGKMLIALGEVIIRGNATDDQFVHTIKMENIPPGFSFAGYRFFPALFGWLSAPLLFLIFCRLMRGGPLTAFLLTVPYLVDNALIVHLRGAMLEGAQLFFMLLLILWYLRSLDHLRAGEGSWWRLAVAGVLFGLTVAVKLNGLVLVTILPAALWELRHRRAQLATAAGGFLVAGALTWCGVWYLHYSIITKVDPELEQAGYFSTNREYRALVDQGRGNNPFYLPAMLAEQGRYLARFTAGVPRPNLCRPDENGSPPFLWPVGARAIEYRWERASDGKGKYLYLQSNPAGWLFGLVGAAAATCLVISAFFVPLRERFVQPAILVLCVVTYGGYMAGMLAMSRVMYLYHYFMPLLLSFLMAGLVVQEVRALGPVAVSECAKRLFLFCMAGAAVAAYWIYSPLTYYQPISAPAIEKRALLASWGLRCHGCPRRTPYFDSLKNVLVPAFYTLKLGGLTPIDGTQSDHEPRKNRTTDGRAIVVGGRKYEDGFGVHARSTIVYRLKGEYREFRAGVGVPDYVKEESPGGTVVFVVRGDGRELWRSPVMRAESESVRAVVDVRGVDRFELHAEDAGDGLRWDHAVWLEPVLEK